MHTEVTLRTAKPAPAMSKVASATAVPWTRRLMVRIAGSLVANATTNWRWSSGDKLESCRVHVSPRTHFPVDTRYSTLAVRSLTTVPFGSSHRTLNLPDSQASLRRLAAVPSVDVLRRYSPVDGRNGRPSRCQW